MNTKKQFLFLLERISFNNWTAQPICYPKESECAAICSPGTNVVLSGWHYEGGALQKINFQLPAMSGDLDPRWVQHVSD